MLRTHYLKAVSTHYKEVQEGNKCFEITEKNKNYRKGDTLFLCEYECKKRDYTGRILELRITYITEYAQRRNYVVIGTKIINNSKNKPVLLPC